MINVQTKERIFDILKNKNICGQLYSQCELDAKTYESLEWMTHNNC